MNDDRDCGGAERPTNVVAAGAIAVVVCAALIGLFVWQPWSPSIPPTRPAASDAR